ncbi:MAG: ATP synthase subunit C [Oscillospiraceae bacterium]|nr:ATP synthase subunit C [Oscillospiraceae bacterium]MDY4587781.1 ATP synthase subunit C [Oscillospiraceae bacterium]
MEYIMLFALPLIIVGAIMLPLFINLKRTKDHKPTNRKRAVITNAASFIGVMALMTIIPLTGAFAETADAAAQTAAGAADSFTNGMKYLGAALSTGLATIGTGIAVGGAAPAAIGAVSENDKAFTKALIFVALGEGVAIYGLLISILILFG